MIRSANIVKIALGVSALLTLSCSILNEILPAEVPTKQRMEGIWEVTAAYDSSGTKSILTDIAFPVAAFWLNSDNSVLSTAGPMTTFLVYGPSEYSRVLGKVQQVFDYTKLKFNGGEWFIDNGVVDSFTLEMKLEGVGGTSVLSDLLSLLHIPSQFLKTVVYHKFINVGVTFDSFSDTVMTWHFDARTTTRYNMKNSQGDYVLWEGWTVPFAKGTFELHKRLGPKTLEEFVASKL